MRFMQNTRDLADPHIPSLNISLVVLKPKPKHESLATTILYVLQKS
jgi:hypothetical protein